MSLSKTQFFLFFESGNYVKAPRFFTEYHRKCKNFKTVDDESETYFVLVSDIDHFDSKEYEMLLSRFSFGTYKKHIT